MTTSVFFQRLNDEVDASEQSITNFINQLMDQSPFSVPFVINSRDIRNCISLKMNTFADLDTDAVVYGIRFASTGDADNVFSSWLSKVILDAESKFHVKVGIKDGMYFRKDSQFSRLSEEIRLVAVGSQSKDALSEILENSAKFSRSRFDKDGYIK